MPIEKQSLNNFLPDGFETLNQEGYKENFNEDKIKTGYEKDVPDIVSGPNLNNLIDVVGKNTNTLNNYVEYLNGMPINNVPTTDENGQLNYINLDDKLTKKQITNCILEIPQRIKYTLENGTLTIKAGSVVIVPYGTEDKTSQFPVGATFINDNYKVVDTQFADGKFFVWAEVQSDIYAYNTDATTSKRPLLLDLTNNSMVTFVSTTSSDTQVSSSSNNNNYRTDLNIIQQTKGGTLKDAVMSFPLLKVASNNGLLYYAISEIYNGSGYIGSTIWVDKGIKGLIPNGRNLDKTLNNKHFSTYKLNIRTVSSSVDTDWTVRIDSRNIIMTRKRSDYYEFNTFADLLNKLGDGSERLGDCAYVIEDNIIYYNSDTGSGWFNYDAFPVANYHLKANGNIETFTNNMPFRAVDYKEVDGNWVYKQRYLIETNTSFTSGQERKYDLSDYLPNDGCLYEVILTASVVTGNTNGNHLNLLTYSDFITSAVNICRTVTRTNSPMYSSGCVTMLIGSGRWLSLTASSGSSGTNYADSAQLKAYRKVR